MRKVTSALMALIMALFTFTVSAPRAEAHSRHGDGALAFGIAAAVIGGIALSRSHHRHRYYDSYYDNGYDDGYYDTPRYSYRRSYNRGYSPSYSRSYSYGSYGGHHGHHHH